MDVTSDNHVRIFDTTLRDGEQSPGATMTLEEKLRVAKKLEDLGVDVIEAGFPAASPGELASVSQIAQLITESEVAGLCRTREPDIEAGWKAVSPAKLPRLHVFIATSKLHMEHKLKLSPDQVLEEIRRGVGYAASLCQSVEFSAEDATRTDLTFLKEAFACAVENGATVVNIPDTVGYTMPEEYTRIVREVMTVVGSRALISTHCHNDLGLAVANSLAAVAAGARQVECCVNGIGERAGNAALEEIVMALKVRRDLLGCDSRIDTRQIMGVSRLVSHVTSLKVQASKPIVGRNAFAHEAGIHQHGMLKDRRTYEIMRPEDVGIAESKIVLGKHSGRHALQKRLEELGFGTMGAAQLDKIFAAFKILADKKKVVYDEDLTVLVADDVLDLPQRYELLSVEFKGGNTSEAWGKVQVRIDGQAHVQEATGNGPVHAVFEALKQCTDNNVLLEEYHLDALSGGSDAQGNVRLSISGDGLFAHGRATHLDIVVASAHAFVAALNHRAYQLELSKRRVASA